MAGKTACGDVSCEDAEDDEVVELEGAAEAGEQNDLPAGGRDAIRCCHALAKHIAGHGRIAVVLRRLQPQHRAHEIVDVNVLERLDRERRCECAVRSR